MTRDTDDTVTYRPPIRRVIRGLLSDYGRVSDDLLVSMTHAETDADPCVIRDTVWSLEARGEIYNARPNDGTATWKVTRP